MKRTKKISAPTCIALLTLIVLMTISVLSYADVAVEQATDSEKPLASGFSVTQDTSSAYYIYRDHTKSAVKYMTMDHAQFRYDDDYIQLELYALVVRDFLGVEDFEEGVHARYAVTFRVLTESDSVLIESSWIRNSTAPDSASWKSGQRIPELIKYILLPGTYKVQGRVDDLVRGTFFEVKNAIELRPVKRDELCTSDLMLASYIERSMEPAGEFDHNGLLVLPNAERMYGDPNPRLFYYAEFYNLKAGGNNQYTTFGRVLTPEGELVRPLRQRVRPALASHLVEVDAFSVATLRTGSYILELSVVDPVAKDTATVQRSFWVYREGDVIDKPRAIGYPGFDVAALTEEEVEYELEIIYPILTERGRLQMRNINSPEAKRQFLTDFWSANDPQPTTPINEFREEYEHRLKIVLDRYGTFGRPGYKTDRGRVYLKYGQADNIEDNSFSGEKRHAYQIWTYDTVEGGVIFVFVDRTNLGDYVQVHSTKQGELYNENWEETELE